MKYIYIYIIKWFHKQRYDQIAFNSPCEAGPDGVSLGDCPFTHSVQMTLGPSSAWADVKVSSNMGTPKSMGISGS